MCCKTASNNEAKRYSVFFYLFSLCACITVSSRKFLRIRTVGYHLIKTIMMAVQYILTMIRVENIIQLLRQCT